MHPLEHRSQSRTWSSVLVAALLHLLAFQLLVARLSGQAPILPELPRVPGEVGHVSLLPTPIVAPPPGAAGIAPVSTGDIGLIVPVPRVDDTEIDFVPADALLGLEGGTDDAPVGFRSGGYGTSGAIGAFPDITPPADFRAAEQVTPVLLHTVAPVYPDLARQAEVEGTVRLRVFVDVKGAVRDIQVIEGSAMLIKAATDAVRRFQFRPALQGGTPVGVWVDVPIEFSLR